MEGQEGKTRRKDYVGCVTDLPEDSMDAAMNAVPVTLWGIAQQRTDLHRAGCAIAWALVNAQIRLQDVWRMDLFKVMFPPHDQHMARPKAVKAGRRRVFPLRLGPFEDLQLQLQRISLAEATSSSPAPHWGDDCWILACMYAVNGMFGMAGPLRKGGWTKAERQAVSAIGKSVNRALCHGRVQEPCNLASIEELKKKRVNYQGEEMGTCHRLTLEQVLPALPPKEHAASINAIDFLSPQSAYMMTHPEEAILPDDGRTLPRLNGIIHADSAEMRLIAAELTTRGVCDWLPLREVACYRGSRVLNGMFGVEKAAKLPNGKPILRLIMNLVGSNATMRQFSGAVRNLPAITSWMSTVVSEEETIRFWQSDMSNAFYLFRVPDQWKKYLSFNYIETRWNEKRGIYEPMALSCQVLPMGWLSSVSIMQEISERILHSKQLDPEAQIVRNKPIPPWMVGIIKQVRQTSRFWWHVYLDNFAAGQIISDTTEMMAGMALHEQAELAWSAAGVLSSDKKRTSAVSSVEELGAFVDGDSGYMGGSPKRMLRLIQATLWLLGQPRLSKKLVQVIAGRWIHVMQFRRPTMCTLDQTWQFIGKGMGTLKLEPLVRRELFRCLLLVPLMHTGLKTPVSKVVTASDASMKGGAVGFSEALSSAGEDFARSLKALPSLSGHIPVLVISLFGGIGGSFRTYDILGLLPMGLVHFDINKAANRVVSRRWPQTEMYEDVKLFNEELLRDILSRHLGIEEIHLWGGFPCIDLSSVNATGTGLAGPHSSLFYELVRIKDMIIKEVGHYLKVKTIVENVASMKPDEASKISSKLGQVPYFLDPADAVPMHRPRLCWCSEPLEDCLAGITITHEARWKRVWAEAPYPDKTQWIEPGVEWPGGEQGYVLPTAMKCIVRNKPPYKPAGIHKCSQDALKRYEADQYRYPPYQYQWQYIFFTEHGTWRTIQAEEKELLMGFGWKHTCLCKSASEIKASYQQYDDLRHTLLGDSFNIFSFIIPCAALCSKFLPGLSYKHLANRMGLAPGIRSALRTTSPLARRLQYGYSSSSTLVGIDDINRHLLSRTNHTGSDIRITTGEVLNPKAFPRQGVQADWWHWKAAFSLRWNTREHINLLELRSILLSVQYQISHKGLFQTRSVHLTDSYVCMSVISKGRTSSQQLGRLLRQLNAYLLAFDIYLILGHVESTDNPTDGASRAVDVQR